MRLLRYSVFGVILLALALNSGCVVRNDIIRVDSEPRGLLLEVPMGDGVHEFVTPCDLPEDVSLEAVITVKDKYGNFIKEVRLCDLPQISERTYLIR